MTNTFRRRRPMWPMALLWNDIFVSILQPERLYSWCFPSLLYSSGTAVTQWLRCCATNRKVAGSIPAGVIGFFIDIKSFRSHYGPGVDSASNRNEYQEYFLEGKGGRCVRLITYHHPVSSRSLGTLTSWKLLGPSGPCNGTDLPLPLLYSFKRLSAYTFEISHLFSHVINNVSLSILFPSS